MQQKLFFISRNGWNSWSRVLLGSVKAGRRGFVFFCVLLDKRSEVVKLMFTEATSLPGRLTAFYFKKGKQIPTVFVSTHLRRVIRCARMDVLIFSEPCPIV